MNTILFSCLLALCILGSAIADTYVPPPLPVCQYNPPNAYMAPITPNVISAVQAFLPESKPVATSLLSQKVWDPNFLFDFSDTPGFTEAYIDVTILWEGAGYRNQFGYFTYTTDNKGDNPKIVKEVVLFPDVSFPNSGEDYTSKPACLQPRVSTRIGPFTQGQRVGWFCYPNGFRKLDKVPLYSVVELNKGNAKGEVHVFVSSLQGQYIVALEDISPLTDSDRDYNDIVFIASTTKAGKITVPEIPADCKDPLCNGRGLCNKTTLRCDCASTSATSYYSGDSCETIINCPGGCGAGVCTSTGCVCDKTRYSADCKSCAAGRFVFPTCDPCSKKCDKGCNPDGSCVIPPPPPPPVPPPTCLVKPFLDASDYQVFVSGSFTAANSDIQTRLAAGGDVSLTQYSLGETLALTDSFTCQNFLATDNKNTLVVGGALNFPSGNVRVGNIIYGTSANIGAGVSGSLAVGCISAPGSVIDFAGTFGWISGLSRTFRKYSTNGNAYLDPSNKDKIIFQAPTSAPSGNNYVFSVDGTLLEGAKFVSFVNVPTTAALIIVNVASNKGRFAFTDASFDEVINGGLASRIIWNFNDARSISITRIGLAGTILAPFAAVTGEDSVISGRIYAASFAGSTQVNADVAGPPPCILSNIKIEVDDNLCPPCFDGAVAGAGCKCSCPGLSCVAPKVANPTGDCNCVCNDNPACPLGVDANCQCLAAGTATNNGQCVSNPFGWLSDFQIATESATTVSSSYIGGRAAAGGALSLTRVSLGLDLVSTQTDDCGVSGTTYVSGGLATINAGNVVGNIAHGDTCQFSSYIAVPPFPRKAYCEFPNYSPASFQAGGAYSIAEAFNGVLRPLSQQLADPSIFPTTGFYSKVSDIITLYGANTKFEVFSIDATDLSNTRRIDVRGLSAGPTVVINIVGSTSVIISKIGLQSLVPFSRLLIWNAPGALTFSVTNVALPGYILAPNAAISNPVGQIIGGAYVASFAAKGNIFVPWLGAFGGCLPITRGAYPCAPCNPGSARLDTSCTCTSLVSISALVTSDFGFNTGYSVKYTIASKHSKPLSSVVVSFPVTTCPIQTGTSGAQVFALNAVAGVANQFSTPSWTGFNANGYNFIAIFNNPAGGCSASTPVVPTIVSVSYD